LGPDRAGAHVAFTAHSIPVALAAASAYEAQLAEAARLVAERLDDRYNWAVVYQSRSGPPGQAWLGPDIGEHLVDLAERGVKSAVMVPIGFVADHMEVVHDLDIVAHETAEAAGLNVARAATVGTDPAFVAMIAELVDERMHAAPPRALGSLPPAPYVCGPGCCPAAR
jgi:ferrochelatase